MKKFRLENQGVAIQDTKWMVVLRISLGILLCTKGYDLMSNNTLAPGLMAINQRMPIPAAWLTDVVGTAQVMGGVFIAFGLFTRMAGLIQLPIVVVALLIKFSDFTLSDISLLEIVAAIVGLVFFIEKGGGYYSLDRYLKYDQTNNLVFWT